MTSSKSIEEEHIAVLETTTTTTTTIFSMCNDDFQLLIDLSEK